MMVMPSTSSLDYICRFLFAAIAFATLGSGAIRVPNSEREVKLSCPTAIEVLETAAPIANWQVNNGTVRREFERISIYNGKNGGREFELAPDDQKEDRGRITQIWHLRGYRTMNVFLRCRYRDTQVVFVKDVPERFETCTLSFESDKRGKITRKSSFACR